MGDHHRAGKSQLKLKREVPSFAPFGGRFFVRGRLVRPQNSDGLRAGAGVAAEGEDPEGAGQDDDEDGSDGEGGYTGPWRFHRAGEEDGGNV